MLSQLRQMGSDLILGPFTSFYLLKNSWRAMVIVFWICLKAQNQKAVTRASLSLRSTETGHTPKVRSLEQRSSEKLTALCTVFAALCTVFLGIPPSWGGEAGREKKHFVLRWWKQLSLTLLSKVPIYLWAPTKFDQRKHSCIFPRA